MVSQLLPAPPVDLALVVIARDEARCIERCLASARPLVDTMIVLDTGSRDATAAIAGQAGAIVAQFDWCDDFAAARNAALDLSPARWNLVLDADEWLDGKGAVLLRGALAAEPFIGLLPVASEFDLDGRVERSVAWLPRLLPAGVRYWGRIHEQPVSSLPRRRLPLSVVHDGYRQRELVHKRGRNEALLLRALAEAPDNAYLRYQLGKNYEVYQDYAQAVEQYRLALAVSPAGVSFRHELVVRSLFALKKSGAHEQALALAQAEMANWEDSPDFFFVLGDLLLDWAAGAPTLARELVPMIESSWLRCLEIGERPELSGTVAGRGSRLAAHNLAVLYGQLGDAANAARYLALAGES